MWADFITMHRRLMTELDRRLQRESRISQADYGVLLALFQQPDRQLRVNTLGEILVWEKSRLSHQLTRMAARGLIERRECDVDGRGTWVLLTTEGRRTLLGAMRDHAAAIRELFLDRLEPGDGAAIAGLTTRVLGGLED